MVTRGGPEIHQRNPATVLLLSTLAFASSCFQRQPVSGDLRSGVVVAPSQPDVSREDLVARLERATARSDWSANIQSRSDLVRGLAALTKLHLDEVTTKFARIASPIFSQPTDPNDLHNTSIALMAGAVRTGDLCLFRDLLAATIRASEHNAPEALSSASVARGFRLNLLQDASVEILRDFASLQGYLSNHAREENDLMLAARLLLVRLAWQAGHAHDNKESSEQGRSAHGRAEVAALIPRCSDPLILDRIGSSQLEQALGFQALYLLDAGDYPAAQRAFLQSREYARARLGEVLLNNYGAASEPLWVEYLWRSAQIGDASELQAKRLARLTTREHPPWSLRIAEQVLADGLSHQAAHRTPTAEEMSRSPVVEEVKSVITVLTTSRERGTSYAQGLTELMLLSDMLTSSAAFPSPELSAVQTMVTEALATLSTTAQKDSAAVFDRLRQQRRK